MNIRQSLIAFPLLLAICPTLCADPSTGSAYIERLVSRSIESGLAFTPGWLALGHYKPGVMHTWTSQADDYAFFLSSTGKHDPVKELAATIRAFAAPVVNVDEHAQCRFPARYHWLRSHLQIDSKHLAAVECRELNHWLDTLRPGSLTLVFPAAYINSPSSMFGHTLLRVNPNDYRKDSPLVAYALNYAANADTGDNALIFTIKGLMGGYPGIFSIVPYFEKIREYRDLENRDIWEYDLDFKLDEVTQLMRHAWEVRNIQFDYYFFTENCSYHMLSLMETARPGLDLTSHFRFKAIPSDTVRAVVDAGLVKRTHYRASSTQIITQHMQKLGNDNQTVLDIVDGKTGIDSAESMSPLRQARIYEQAYDYARFLSSSDPSANDQRASLNWQVLSARSRLTVDDAWEPIREPAVRTEQGHKTGRAAIGSGSEKESSYLSFKLRPAYHDLLDPPAGFTHGAQINFFDISFRYFTEPSEFRLKKLTLIDVLSLTPRNAYFKPVSWSAEFSLERQLNGQGEQFNATQVIVDGGYSYEPLSGFTVSLLGEVDVRASSHLAKGHAAGAGLAISLLTQRQAWSMLSSIKGIDFNSGEKNYHRQFSMALGFHFSAADSLRFTFERERNFEQWRNDAELSWHHYF